jgi:hypothetical protein
MPYLAGDHPSLKLAAHDRLDREFWQIKKWRPNGCSVAARDRLDREYWQFKKIVSKWLQCKKNFIFTLLHHRNVCAMGSNQC